MKKSVVVAIFILLFSTGFSRDLLVQNETKEHTVKRMFYAPNCSTIMLLSDNSLWIMFTLEKQTQTWSQWWQDIQPIQPKDVWVCDFTRWTPNDHVKVYCRDRKNENIPESLKNDNIRKSEYIVYNSSLNNYAFARPTNVPLLLDFFSDVMKVKYNAGYRKGKEKGYVEGWKKGRHSTKHH